MKYPRLKSPIKMYNTSELNKHRMIYQQPYIYACSCGFKAYVFIPDGEEIIDTPASPIEYLKCGHAVCAKIQDEHGKFLCLICGQDV